MADSSPTFGSTITSGIQDITAILPLLGTEQCERHTETALTKGFLYTAVAPISIFGSLGIVKAGASVLMLAFPARRGFWGAKFLADGGFRLEGAVAPMIACHPEIPTKFLAETKFEQFLANAHVEDVGDLKIDSADKTWNIRMIFSTLIISSLGFTPYIYIILRSKPPHQSPLLVLFPAARILGCMITCILVQVIIQIRILVIVKSRLIFMHTDRYIRNSMPADDREFLIKNLPHWHADQASELCLQELQYFLDSSIRKYARRVSYTLAASSLLVASAFEGLPTTQPIDIPLRLSPLQKYLSDTQKKYLPESKFWIILRALIFPFLLLLGLLLSIAGYVGTFNLIQKSEHNGPIFWLVFEGVLCLFRIAIWGWNPTWDDNQGVRLSLIETTKSSLLTTAFSVEEMVQMDTAAKSEVSLIRSGHFLEELVSYTGPLPTFAWDGASFYYFLGVSQASGPHQDHYKVLCIVLHNYSEQTSRLIYRNPGEKEYKYLILADQLDTRNAEITISLRNATSTTAESHSLTSNPRFLELFTKHYNAIMDHLDVVERPSVIFSASWAFHFSDKEIKTAGKGQKPSVQSQGQKSKPGLKLTTVDQRYFDYRRFGAERDTRSAQLGIWVQEYLKTYVDASCREIPDDIPEAVKSIELLEVAHFVTTVARILERNLLSTYTYWNSIGDDKYTAMMRNANKYFNTVEPVGSETRIDFFITLKLQKENTRRAAHARKTDFDNMKERMRKEMDDLVQAAKPHTTNDSTVIDVWTQNLGLNNDWDAYIQNDTMSTSTNITIPRSGHTDAVATYVLNMERRLSDKAEVLGRCRSRANKWQKVFECIIAPYLSLYSPVMTNANQYVWKTGSADVMHNGIAQEFGNMYWEPTYLVVSNILIAHLSGFENLVTFLQSSAISVLYFDFNTPVAPTEDLSKDDELRYFRARNQDIKLSDLDLAIYQILKDCSRVTDIHFSDKNYSVPKLLTETIEHRYNILVREPGFQYVVRFEDVDFSNHQGSLFQSHIKLKKSDSSKCIVAAYDRWSTTNYALSLTYRLTMADETKIKVIPIRRGWQPRKNLGKSEVHREFAISVHVEQAGYRIQRLNIHIKLHGDSDEIYLLNVDLTPTDDSE